MKKCMDRKENLHVGIGVQQFYTSRLFTHSQSIKKANNLLVVQEYVWYPDVFRRNVNFLDSPIIFWVPFQQIVLPILKKNSHRLGSVVPSYISVLKCV